MRERLVSFCMIGGIVLLLAFVVYIIILAQPKEIEHRYSNGMMVRAKLDNRPGMVVAIYPHVNKYNVRFTCTEQATATRILSPDEAIENSPYAIVVMMEYELIDYEERPGE